MPGANHREREAKFQVAPDLLPSLQIPALPFDDYTVQPLGILNQTDSYLDTQSYDLLRHGLALRVRQSGTAYEVGIKSLQAARKGVIQDRLDVSIPLPPRAKPFDVSTWPTAVEEQLEAHHVKIDALRPLVVVRQQRQKAYLSPLVTGKPLAEWSLDEVWISAKADGDGSYLTHFHELEIESLGQDENHEEEQESDPASESAFSSLVAQVKERFVLSPIYTSKFVRGLETTFAQAHAGASALAPEMELAAGCRLLLHQQLLQILLNEHGVRFSKKAKFVHDMRVAIRRARAIMQLCGDFFDPQALAPHEKGLRRLGRALGAVRDLDVALGNLRDFGRTQPTGKENSIKTLRAEIKKRRAHAYADLLALLDSKKHRRFITAFDNFCASAEEDAPKVEETGYEYPPSQVRHTIPSIILAVFEAMRAYEVAFAGSKLPALETFHALRIQSKYLRYLLEFTQHLLGSRGEILIAQIIEIQEHLGRLNDAHVEQERLQLWLKQIENDTELCSAIEERQAEIATQITKLTTTFPPRFATFINHPNRKRLGAAIAQL